MRWRTKAQSYGTGDVLFGMAFISALLHESIRTNGTETKEFCYDTPFNVTCEILKGAYGTVDFVQWKAYDPRRSHWALFGYCNREMRCEIKRALLSNGIQVLQVVKATITLQVSSKTSTDNQSRLRCRVDFEGHTPLPHEVTINFVYCITAHKTDGEVNLSKFLESVIPWKEVDDVRLFDIEGIEFAYCKSKVCARNKSGPLSVLWNRTTVQSGSLFLTGIEESDSGLRMKAKTVSATSTRLYTIKVLVNSSQGRNSLTPTALPITGTANSSPGSSSSGPTGSPSESFAGHPTKSIVGSPSKSAAASATQCIVRAIVTIFLAVLVPVIFIWWRLRWNGP